MKYSTTPQDHHPVSRNIDQEVLRAIASIQYGSVEIIIHEGQVVQIECREKIRIHSANNIRRIE
ncbi:MAG: YezD family protein [Nitrosomonas sp.]|nr:YezD family protein [Nitrosomonas sp.]MCW5606844.1 YezD family protein [Nitrosomonas sp.]